ncbi:MarR family winged helix-turn-helix transcriptional regulator [Yinghuangia sp. YIM S09857]|uniref:MarR family winged helix-turn-helix transcriptional regulator n=1 Tax=Yinghuangia sp. YIM S09857 TaxID=3436929 RepID=UPI003F52CA26
MPDPAAASPVSPASPNPPGEPRPAPAPAEPGEADGVDFLSFVDFAVRRAARRQPGIDAEALRMILLINRVANVVTYDLESAVHRPQGWTWPAFRLLNVLWLAGPTEGKRIAEMSGMSRAAISSLANTLEKQGLVARGPAPHDGRAVTLRLTEAGEGALAAAYRAQNARERQWAEALSDDERATFVELLGKVAAHATGDWVRRRD